MGLQPENMLQHYRLVEKIGEGGMGVVWKAVDTRLGREVAIKILPEEFAGDPERLSRFEREAKALASLNHPNIATIYGLERSDDIHFLALELVPGRTLMEVLKAGPLAVDAALPLVLQIAEAVEAAHEAGIIHRDLKPANIKVTDDGQVKVLDFGLAKALEGELGSISPDMDPALSPTLTSTGTRAGMILGTAAYMSPEQARGRIVDKRADIWAFGCVLYEMLSGRQAFEGETVSDKLAAVLKSEPDWNALPSAVPELIRRLLRRCLEKDPKQRLRDIGEARIEIQEAISGDELAPEATVGTTRKPRCVPLLAAGIALGAAVAAVVLVWIKPWSAPEQRLRKFEIAVAEVNPMPAISPDGSRIAYSNEGRLWIRELDDPTPREIQGSENGVVPFWSPRSDWVGFAQGREIWKAHIDGGDKTAICRSDRPVSDLGGGAGWGLNGKIIFTDGNSGLYEVSALGGEPRIVLEPGEGEVDFHQASALPDGKGYLFVVHREEATDTLSLFDGEERKDILVLPGKELAWPAYSRTGHILYRLRTAGGVGLWAVPFSLSKMEAVGDPFLVERSAGAHSVSGDGTLVYVTYATIPGQLAWVDRQGKVLETIGDPDDGLLWPALSPDEKHAALTTGFRLLSGEESLWIYDLSTGSRRRLTFEGEAAACASWSQDGGTIAFSSFSTAHGISAKLIASDGSSESETVAQTAVFPYYAPDGKSLIYTHIGGGNFDIWHLPLHGDGRPSSFLSTEHNEGMARVSPDGRYVAYQSNESGSLEVYLRRYPSGEGKWLVSAEGGISPVWSRRGDKLYYFRENDLMEVNVSTSPSLKLGTPRMLFRHEPCGHPLIPGLSEGFDVSGDGQRFLMVTPTKAGKRGGNLRIVENWFSEFSE